MPSNAATITPPVNWNTLGSLWIAYAILRLIVAILLVLYSGTATVMFGALLTRVPDPLTLMTIFHVCYFVAIIVTILSGLFGLFAGLALLARNSSARSLSIVASLLSLSDLPFGTTLGTYTLILFFR
jgi:uncharacterized membrane protein